MWKGTNYVVNQNNWSLPSNEEVTFWSITGQKLVAYGVTQYQPGGANTLPQLVAAQTGTNYYFGGKLIKNSTGYVTPDRLGSIGKYFPYGQERPSATTDGKEKFATYFRDSETGLDYADQRYEQPGMGRFTTPDRMKGKATDPGSWNKYAYTGGDPINRLDPSGAAWVCVSAEICWEENDFLTQEDLCLMNVGGCQMYGIPLYFFAPPQGGGGGGPPPSASTVFHATANSDCQKGLLSGMSGPDNDVNDQARLDAIGRADASSVVLKKAADAYGIPWEWLAAIAIQESHFQNIDQKGGGHGVGVFQIDLSRNPNVTRDQAEDLTFSANWATKYLANNYRALQRGGLSGDALVDATFDTYNAGLGNVRSAIRQGKTPDSATTPGNYGSSALGITKCF